MAETLPPPLDEFLEAWNDWDVERMLGILHPEVEIRGIRSELEDTTYRGLDGAQHFFADSDEAWERNHAELIAYERFGGNVAATMSTRLRARESQVELEQTFGILFRLEGGLIRVFFTYFDVPAAYEAASAGYPRHA